MLSHLPLNIQNILVRIAVFTLILTVPVMSNAVNIEDTIHGISTPIESQLIDRSSQGTGFFFLELGSKDPTKESQWVKIENVWLISNRHVVLPKINGIETIPETFTFYLRKYEGEHIVWVPITLQKKELLARAMFHANAEVDVCAIRILDLIIEKMKSGGKYLQWYGVSKDNFPGSNKIYPNVASDAVVIGYPRGFYDKVNLFPIVKSGIIASRWGSNFDGKPYFLIDAKLFPGSSGSLVISKPTNMVVEKGQVFISPEKPFAFLGIYSGEPYQQNQPIEFDDFTLIRKSGFNLGIVWYANLVEEIIYHGVQLSKP